MAHIESDDSHQRLLRFLLVPETHGQEVAVPAVLAGPLVEFACSDVSAMCMLTCVQKKCHALKKLVA
jgi:hypothetical protein